MDKKVYFAGEVCSVVFGIYGVNGRTSMSLENENGEPMAHATVNLPDIDLEQNEVVIKDYSENEGMLNALIASKIVTDTGRRVKTGFVECPVCRLV